MSPKVLLAVAGLVVSMLVIALRAQVKDTPPPVNPPAAEVDPFGAGPAVPAPKPKPPASLPAGDDPFAADPKAAPARPQPARTVEPPNPFSDGPAEAPPAARPEVQPNWANRHATSLVGAGSSPLGTGDEAILKALGEPTSFEFIETPLSDVVAFLADLHRVPVELDKKGLADAGVDEDTPINSKLKGLPLRSALDLGLRQISAAWTVKSGVLVITSQEAADANLVIKCYDVSDLLATATDSPYRGDRLPTVPPGENSSLLAGLASGTMPSAATGLGTMGGGIFGGMTGSGPARSHGIALDADLMLKVGDELVSLIRTTIAPTTWDAVGGPGTIVVFDRSLVVGQTMQLQFQVEALLTELRAKRQAVTTVVVDLRWLWLDAAQFAQLAGEGQPSSAVRAGYSIDAAALEQLARKAPGFRGLVACANGQAVHLVSGDRRLVITGATPTASGLGTTSTTAYQPVIAIPNFGVLVQLRPTIAPGAETAQLEVQSTVSRWGTPGAPARFGAARPAAPNEPAAKPGESQPAGEAEVDRPVVSAQELAATVNVPLGKPVVLGGMTFAPSDDAGLAKPSENPAQLYLIATVCRVPAAQPAKPPAPAAPKATKP